MYSVVLAMALSGSAEVPDFGRRGCNGCNGCWGGCSGYVAVGCCGGYRNGCYGGGYYNGCRGCYGGTYYGCSGYYSGVYSSGCCGGVIHSPEHRPMPPVPPVKKDGTVKPPPNEESEAPPAATAQTPDRTTVVVNLPANARLTINGSATQSTGATRRFITPALPLSSEYFYILTAEFVQDQQTVVQTRRVTFRPGQEVQVSFDPTAQVVAR